MGNSQSQNATGDGIGHDGQSGGLGNLMERVLKRDDDAELIENINDGQLTVITTENVEELDPSLIQREIPPLLDNTLLELEANQRMMDVTVQVIQVVFTVANVIFLLCAIFAASLYWVLDLDETRQVVVVTTMVAFSMMGGFYITLAVTHKAAIWIAPVLLVAWSFFFMIVVGCVSALLRNMTPMQLMLMGWSQTLVILIICNISRTHVSILWASIWMCVATLVIWGISIYAFLVERDWVASFVILGMGLLLVCYNGIEIMMIQKRSYSLHSKHKIDASVKYWVDPLLGLFWLVSWPFKKCCCNNKKKSVHFNDPISDVNVESLGETPLSSEGVAFERFA